MKKKLLLLAAALVLGGCSVAQAALTDKVAGMIRADKFLMTYTTFDREVGSGDVSMKAGEDYSNPYTEEISIASNGAGKKLLVTGGHKKDGSLYGTTKYMMYAGPEEVYAVEKPSKEGESYVDDNLAITPTMTKIRKSDNIEGFADAYNKQLEPLLDEFLTILPERNRISGLDGSITHINYCADYNGSGTQDIDGTVYTYEEFVTPSNHLRREVARYYFDGTGSLVALIHMKAPYEYVYGEGTKKFPGSYRVFRFKKLTDAVTDSIFKIPATVEVKGDD